MFQEAARAPNNTCLIRSFSLELLDILRVTRWLRDSRLPGLTDLQGLIYVRDLHGVVDEQFGRYSKGRRPSLTTLLEISRWLNASEPRDFIYGMLGLRYQNDVGGKLPSRLVPDYQKPVDEVFRDATREAIDDLKTTQLWRYISHRSEKDLQAGRLPSWVIDLSRKRDGREDPVPLSSFFSRGYCHDKNTVRVVSEADPNVIKITGFPFDDVIPVVFEFTRKMADEVETVQAWMTAVVDGVQKVNANMPVEWAIAPTLLAGRNAERGKATNQDVSAFADLLYLLEVEGRIPPRVRHTTAATVARDRSASRYFHTLWRACTNRRVFFTRSGSVGVGPKIMREGDIIVVFHGGDVPYVLRPHGDHYLLLRACYVHGIMYGEAMKAHIEKGDPDTDFDIR